MKKEKRSAERTFLYIFFALMVLMMNWETQSMATPLVAQEPIPEESIRLRIIANSDDPRDQWLKRKVRDAVIEKMSVWTADVEDINTARNIVDKRMDKIEETVQREIRKHGFDYPIRIQFGKVEFPTKKYGPYVYPAGQYEALKITIGKGLGQNWWCVLFPPLCFVDMSNGDAIEKEAGTKKPAKDNPQTDAEVKGYTMTEKPAEKVQVKFFVLEMWKKIKAIIAA